MNVELILRGVTPLLMHNPQMVDPECEFNRDIKKLTSKRKKTDEDLREIERLEWLGGLYTASVGGQSQITQPTSKVRKCVVNAAKISKQGKSIERALITTALHVPLIYPDREKVTDWADEINRLLATPAYHSRLSVGIGNKRVMRVRPQFAPWAMIVPAVFLTDAGLNFDDLQEIFGLAGRAERIGDNRVNGYGAFEGYIREVTRDSRPIEPTLAGVNAWVSTYAKGVTS